jgi:VWA domain containing CoxE-like protein
MCDMTIQDTGDDLSELTLTQARLITALDDAPVLRPRPLRIVVVVDATTSMREYLPGRRVTLEAARETLRAMFVAASQLEVQVVYFRDDECRASKWFTDPEEAARTIADIEHRPGWTQHERAFRHIIREATKQPIHAVVVLTDAVELRGPGNPNGDDFEALCKDAMRLRRLSCTVTFAYKGSVPNGCPIDRAGPHAEQRIQEIANDNGGCFFLYNPADPKLAKRFGEIATQASLGAKGDGAGAQALLQHLRAVPFEMNAVGEQVPTGKCER